MLRHMRTLPIFLLVAAFTLGGTAILAGNGDDDDDDDEEEIELDEAAVDIEWNSTDDDYGIHFFWDGEAWENMKVENEDGKKVLTVKTKKNVRDQGLTEGFFESAEPDTSELSLEEFLERFPEGCYEFEGETIEGAELVGEAELTHTLPAPPENLSPSGGDTVSKNGFTVSFDEVTEDTEGNAIDIEFYEVVVEKEDDDPILQTFKVILRPGVTSVDVPGSFLESETEYKLEIIAQEESGNRTITETGLFETD
ncbi:MAG: hypothetical protein ACYTGZ_02170 [Planctomycetota bacterium]|jgi:hypothetical protein